MSLPTMNWRSTANSSGSSGNSKKSARTGGVPFVEALANSVYCPIPSAVNDESRI